jgi:hypothetical protein
MAVPIYKAFSDIARPPSEVLPMNCPQPIGGPPPSSVAHPASIPSTAAPRWTTFDAIAPVPSEFGRCKSQSSCPLGQLTLSRIPLSPLAPVLASPPDIGRLFKCLPPPPSSAPYPVHIALSPLRAHFQGSKNPRYQFAALPSPVIYPRYPIPAPSSSSLPLSLPLSTRSLQPPIFSPEAEGIISLSSDISVIVLSTDIPIGEYHSFYSPSSSEAPSDTFQTPPVI